MRPIANFFQPFELPLRILIELLYINTLRSRRHCCFGQLDPNATASSRIQLRPVYHFSLRQNTAADSASSYVSVESLGNRQRSFKSVKHFCAARLADRSVEQYLREERRNILQVPDSTIVNLSTHYLSAMFQAFQPDHHSLLNDHPYQFPTPLLYDAEMAES